MVDPSYLFCCLCCMFSWSKGKIRNNGVQFLGVHRTTQFVLIWRLYRTMYLTTGRIARALLAFRGYPYADA